METKQYTILRNDVGCTIKGLMTEKEVKEFTSAGTWTASQILESVELSQEDKAELNLSKCARSQK